MNTEKTMNVDFTLTKPHFLRCDFNGEESSEMISTYKQKYF